MFRKIVLALACTFVAHTVHAGTGLDIDRLIDEKYQATDEYKTTKTKNGKVVTKLAYSKEQKLKNLEFTIERMQTFIAPTEGKYIIVNIPAYELYAIEDGQIVLTSKVIVGGKLGHTPEMDTNMTNIIYNPTWTPTPRILKEEILPKLANNPGYMGFRPGPNGTYVQPAGPGNALGRMKFNLDDPYNVYMHDTSNRGLFVRDSRGLSHGCIRVQQWSNLAAWASGRPTEAIQNRVATGKTQWEKVDPVIPVYVVYWTADVKDGKVVYYSDPYNKM